MSDTLFIRAAIAPSSIDPEARTVEVVWSTGAERRLRDFDGPFVERLSLRPGDVDLSRLEGASFLDSHQREGLRNVLGVVERAAVDGERGTATVRFSSRAEVEPVWQDVRAGVLRHVSVGYTVEDWREGKTATGERSRTAVRWTPVELSLVPVPADAGAAVRSEDPQMTKKTATPEEPRAEAAPETATPEQTDIATRAATNREIRSMVRVAGLDAGLADELIDRAATPDEARAAIFEAMVERAGPEVRTEQPRVTGGQSFDDPAVRSRMMGEALYARSEPGHELSEPARRYAGMSLPDMAREVLHQRGQSASGMSLGEIVNRALNTTSDFPIILEGTIGRTLRAAYEAADAGLRQLGRQTTARDFRSKTSVQLGELGLLEKVNEHGEYKATTVGEGKEAYKVARYGRVIGISEEVLVNDDLGAFSDMARLTGRAARETENKLLTDLLTANSGGGPKMNDTKNLFHADHGNLAAAGAAPSETTLSDARKSMRLQTGLSGQLIRVTPRYVLVPAALETSIEKLLSTIAAAKTSDVNPFASLVPVVEPRLDAVSATAWYVVADPATFDGLEYAYLEGQVGPQVESRRGFEIDGIEVKVKLVFGAGFVDFRGWYRDPGA